MAKKQAKPLFELKHDFYESLDHALQQAINLMQAVDQVIELDLVRDGAGKDRLKERSAAMRAALMAE